MIDFLKKILNIIKNLFEKGDNNDFIITEKIESKKEFKSNMKILIDNGHGIDTLGKRSPYSASGVMPAIPFFEYKWNREIAEKVVGNLNELGYDAELIVNEIEDIPLETRAIRVNNMCDILGKDNVILISIHSNACGNGSKWEKGAGWEAYTSIGNTKSDKLAEVFYKKAKEIFSDRKIRYDWSDGDCDKEASFYIIKRTKCPAILTENFFYDNIDDVQFILSDEGREKIIKLHVDSIIEYLNS